MRYPVEFKGHLIGTLIPDLIVDDLVIVDTKVAMSFTDTHTAQMIGYLSKVKLDLALLINFKYAKLTWKRIVQSIHY